MKSLAFLIILLKLVLYQDAIASLAIYERSDTCSSRHITLVLNDKTDCTKLIEKNRIVSSVKINGKCRDITDTSIEKACLSLQDDSGKSTIYEGSDSCSPRDIILSVGNYSNCKDYAGLRKDASSIKINGVCQNITDTSVEKACNEIQLKRGLDAIYSGDNDCFKDNATVFLNNLTNCQKLEGSASSLKLNGKCQELSKTSLKNACLDIQERVGHTSIYSRTDLCRSRNIVSAVNELTDCSQLVGQASSIKVKGNCQDINDTTVAKSCTDIQRKMGLPAIYNGSDNCSKRSITHTLTSLNDCGNITGSASSIRLEGKCIDITDTSAYRACVDIQSHRGLSVIFSTSDDCKKSDKTTVLTKFTKCSSLEGRASSVKVKGKCLNITDSSLEKACLQIKDNI